MCVIFPFVLLVRIVFAINHPIRLSPPPLPSSFSPPRHQPCFLRIQFPQLRSQLLTSALCFCFMQNECIFFIIMGRDTRRGRRAFDETGVQGDVGNDHGTAGRATFLHVIRGRVSLLFRTLPSLQGTRCRTGVYLIFVLSIYLPVNVSFVCSGVFRKGKNGARVHERLQESFLNIKIPPYRYHSFLFSTQVVWVSTYRSFGPKIIYTVEYMLLTKEVTQYP